MAARMAASLVVSRPWRRSWLPIQLRVKGAVVMEREEEKKLWG